MNQIHMLYYDCQFELNFNSVFELKTLECLETNVFPRCNVDILIIVHICKIFKHSVQHYDENVTMYIHKNPPLKLRKSDSNSYFPFLFPLLVRAIPASGLVTGIMGLWHQSHTVSPSLQTQKLMLHRSSIP